MGRGAPVPRIYRDSGGLQPVETICGGKNSVFRRPITVITTDAGIFFITSLTCRADTVAARNVFSSREIGALLPQELNKDRVNRARHCSSAIVRRM